MKRTLSKDFFISMCFVIAILVGVNGTCKAEDTNKDNIQQLVFLNWSEYMDSSLIEEFEKKYNADVIEIYYESDELKDQMILASNGEGYDVVLGSGISFLSYLKRESIAPLTKEEIPNMENIDPRFWEVYPELNGYAVPYTWGTLGIAYRKDLMGKEVQSWMDIFRPAKELKGKILMINDSRDTIGPALKALGHPLNSTELEHYDEVERLLLAQRPFVAKYAYVVLTDESALVSGKAWAAVVYNGDALVLRERHPQIAFSLPEEGSSLWIDYMAVMRASKRKKLAYDFINFLHEPKNAARLSSFLMFATPNAAALAFLDQEHLSNRMIFPDSKILEKCEVERSIPPRIIKLRNTIFAKIAMGLN